MNTFDLKNRPRRLRQTQAIRALVRETELTPNDVVYPLFIKEGLTVKRPIPSMPGVYQLPLNALKAEIDEIMALKIPAVILFGIPADKDEQGLSALNPEGIIQQATRLIKAHAPELLVMTDLCFCEYTSHGHCGVLLQQQVDNDPTLTLLGKQALSHAEAGADVIAPSGMMDGMVTSIRHALDSKNYQQIPILSYAVKYASAFYGPFRDAAEGAPQFGDRSQYQMDIANKNEALKEAALDIEQGADMLMVKPALCYLDIINELKHHFPETPLAAYQVSGEYSLIKMGGQQGLIDEQKAMIESLTAIKRAGASFIITYFAKTLNQLLLSR